MNQKSKKQPSRLLPKLPITLKTTKPMCYQYSRDDRAKLRKHIKKVRRERNLSIKETAAIIGAVKDVVPRWEANRTVPENSKVGGIIRFLGYNPLGNECDYQ